jgi:hypothetical protein
MVKSSLVKPSTNQINRICNRGVLNAAEHELERLYGPPPEEPTLGDLTSHVERFVSWNGPLFGATAVTEAVRKLDRTNVIDARLVWIGLNTYIMEKQEPPF